MIAFAVPWRPTPERSILFKTVQTYWQYRISTQWYTADSRPGEFSRAQAVNRAVSEASRDGHKVVVISDADTMCELGPLLEAIALTSEDRKPRIPYDTYHLLNEKQTRDFITYGVYFNPSAYEGAVSGVLVVHSDNYTPFDERYIGWGAEDVDWAIRAKPDRVSGTAWALLHTPEPRDISFPRNQKLLRDTHGQHL